MIKNLLLLAALLIAGALVLSQGAFGTVEMAEKEKTSCVTCHTGVGKADLNDRGDYYKRNGTLEGYSPPPSR